MTEVLQNTEQTHRSIQTISILGCGWLGFPLAQYLIEKKYKIRGSTTSETKIGRLQESQIDAYIIDLQSFSPIDPLFFTTDVIVINIPPGLRKTPLDVHLNQLRFFFDQIPQDSSPRIIFVSSTSVYPDLNRIVVETDADYSSEIGQIESEVQHICKTKDLPLTILRFGGLMGYDRAPCKYYSGKTGLKLTDNPVNYIHRDDAVRVIEAIIENNYWGETVNAVSPSHPLRKIVIEDCCQKSEYQLPEYSTDQPHEPFKQIDSSKLRRDLNFEFKYPDPLDFYYE